MSKQIIFASLVATLIVATWALLSRQQSAPAVGALTLSPENSSIVPDPEPEPMIEVGEKTKLFMNNNAYLFGTYASTPEQAALSRELAYRVGVGKEIERASGSRLMGEFSVAKSEPATSDDETVQARLAAAYLKQLNKHSDFRAGLSTDLAPNLAWSTLELQLSMELEGGINLMLNHDFGKSMKDNDYEYQTGIALEKKF